MNRGRSDVSPIFFVAFYCVNMTNWLYLQGKAIGVRMKEIRIVYKTPQFEAFYASLPAKVQTKFKYVIDVITTIYDVSTKFVKHLENTDLYEMRVSVGNNEYRTILFAVDKSNIIESTKIVLLNGFLKKSTKEYRKQIELAQSILKELEQ